MNRRSVTCAAFGLGITWLAGCGDFKVASNDQEQRAVQESGPLESYRAEGPFDANERHFIQNYRYSDKRLASSNGIHASYLDHFIRQAEFGPGRMANFPQAPSSIWIEVVAESQGERPVNEKVNGHVLYDAAAKRLKFPDGTSQAVSERKWQLSDWNLMSTNAESGPSVYLTEAKSQHEIMKGKQIATGATTPKRPLDAFEIAALSKLRSGDEVVLQETGTSLHLLGAIRARQDCLKCHKVEVGTMLGAFTYKLNLQTATPEETPKMPVP